MIRPGLVPPVAPCIVSHNMALGGAQTAILRMIRALPDWVRERTTLYCQSGDMPLLDAAVAKHGFSVGRVTTEAPADPSCWLLSYGNLQGLPQRPTSLILHSWDDEGYRYISRTYGHLRGLTVAGVSQQVLNRYADWISDGGHVTAGLLPPPVTEYAIAKGNRSADRIVVAWMGRPLESKGLMSLAYLLALDKRLVVRAWTGAETAGLEYTRRVQAQAMQKMLKLADELGVIDRLDLRPLDFDPFAYHHRLEGCHVLLGNSRQEGFLLTAAEALSCGIPVVVTRSCGIADFIAEGINGRLIDWDENPRRLARASRDAIVKAVEIDSLACLQSVRDLSLQAGYCNVYGQTLARLTHTSLQGISTRVTVAVRIHKGMPIESLDEAISSLALQTYRRFKTILLVDGPWEYGEMLARRYGLPLLCTGLEPDITHCSGLHRRAVEMCDTEFYKPLDYDDQLLPDYLEHAVRAMDEKKLDVYGCLLMTLENGQFSERKWPHKPLETMFTGNSDDNMLPHSSVLMRTEICRRAGNYQERAVGLGADDYNLWHRIHQSGGKFWRDDRRQVVYRIHEKNSLKIRKARYGAGGAMVGQAFLPALELTRLCDKTVTPGSEVLRRAGSDGEKSGSSEYLRDRRLAQLSRSETETGEGHSCPSESTRLRSTGQEGPALADSGRQERPPHQSPARTGSSARRIAGVAAAAAIALAAVPAAAAPNQSSIARPPTDARQPNGLLERWVSKVKGTGKAVLGVINKIPMPDATPGKSTTAGSGVPHPDLAPPHS